MSKEMDEVCAQCGERFGAHYGVRCPRKMTTFLSSDSAAILSRLDDDALVKEVARDGRTEDGTVTALEVIRAKAIDDYRKGVREG